MFSLLRIVLVFFGIHLLVITGWQLIYDHDEPLSKWIAFISSRSDYLDRQVYKMRIDGLLVKQLTFNGEIENTRMHPSWSPDGTQIAFTTFGGGTRISLIDPSDIKHIQNLITTPPFFNHSMPRWSPDGTKIAFHATQQGDSEIYIMNLEDHLVVQLTNSSGNNTEPAWSPDSQWIAFSSERHGRFEIYRINIDGSQEQRLTDSIGENRYPTWSPDGKWIAFASSRDDTMQIYRMNAYGTNIQRISPFEAASTSPAWSPDGHWLAFVSEEDGNPEIYRMRPDGSQIQILTNSIGENYFPTWSPTDKKQWYEGILFIISSLCILSAGFIKNDIISTFYRYRI